MLTSDTNIVTVRLSAQYQVSNPRDYVLNVRNPEQSLRNALDSTLRHVVGASGMQNVLTSTTEVEEVKEIDEGGEVPDMPETVTDPSELPVITMTPPVPDSLLSGREELGPMVAMEGSGIRHTRRAACSAYAIQGIHSTRHARHAAYG